MPASRRLTFGATTEASTFRQRSETWFGHRSLRIFLPTPTYYGPRRQETKKEVNYEQGKNRTPAQDKRGAGSKPAPLSVKPAELNWLRP